MANFSMGAPEKPLLETDFLPTYLRDDPVASTDKNFDLRKLTPEQQRDFLFSVFSRRTLRKKR